MIESLNNILKLMLNTGKKLKFVLQSALFFIFLVLLSTRVLPLNWVQAGILFVGVIAITTLVLHFPNIKIKTLAPATIMPVTLLVASLVFFSQYSDLGPFFKMFICAGFGFLYYLISLVDNVVLVVHEKEEAIPLYRAALSWSQVVQMLVAIPLLAGIYQADNIKVPYTIVLILLTTIFICYQFWVLSFDTDSKKLRVGEAVFLNLLICFFVVVANFCVVFIPGEEFLRALVISTVMLFGINYFTAYLKNSITKRVLIQYAIIIAVFFSILLVF